MSLVLVVDDDPLILDLLRDAVELAGHDAIEAESGEAALAAIAHGGPRLGGILTDVNLRSAISGWDVAREARKRNPVVPVAYISGEGVHSWAAQGVPGSVMLQKPFTVPQVVRAVQRFFTPDAGGTEPAGVAAAPAASAADDLLSERSALSTLFEQAPGFMALAETREHRLTFVNRAFRHIVGDRELLGRQMRDALPETVDQGIIDMLDRVYDTGNPFTAYGLPLDLRQSAAGQDLQPTRVDVLFHAVRDAQGHVQGVFTQGHDVTQQHLAEERLRRIQSEFIHTSRVNAMGVLASALAHELNQPLTAIANYLWVAQQSAAEGEPNPRVDIPLAKAKEETLRSGELIRKLKRLTMSGQVTREPLDMASILQDAAALALLGDLDLTIRYDLRSDTRVLGDRVQLQQIVINLLRNAVDALEGVAGTLVIGTSDRGRFVEVSVADSGPGIADSMLPHIFEPFTSTKPTGTGVGLAICRTIIEAHGGRLTAANDPDGGAIMRFTVPKAP